MPRPPVLPHDDVARSLYELAIRYGHELSAYAAVERSYGGGAEGVRLRPVRPGAIPIGWVDLGESITVQVADQRPLRLSREPATVDDLRLLCDAVVAGRAYRSRRLLRTRVVLDLADGRTATLPARTDRAIARPTRRAGKIRETTTTAYASYR